MTRRSRSASLLLSAVALLVAAAPAGAYWTAGGGGSGSGAVVTMPSGGRPTATVAGQSVTVGWTQSSLLGSPLGSFAAGGYTLKRYASGTATATTPNASCATTIGGGGATLQCVEASVPYGAWQYSVTPVLDSFAGSESAESPAVEVVTAAPVLSSATAQNPAAGQATGSIQVAWASATGATGYNVYRRTTAGSFDFAAPLNGATPVAGTTYADPGAGLSASTTYHYVVRALAGSPAVASASSNSLSAATITRPAAPASVTATAGVAARIDVAWPAVAGVAGYNVYRRVGPTYAFGSALNGATPQTPLTYADLALTNGTSYRYTVRAVVIGAGGAQVESVDADSAVAAADGVAPSMPTASSVTGGGPLWTPGTCSIAATTRYVNDAGKGAVDVSATIPTPETGETIVFSATTPGSTPVSTTVAATGTTVTATLNLSTLLDGTISLTALAKDLAGNPSATRAPASVVIKDTVGAALSATYSGGFLGLDPHVGGASECGATVVAVKTYGGNTGAQWSTTIGSGTSYNIDVEGPLLGLGTVMYDVTATDRAGNPGSTIATGG